MKIEKKPFGTAHLYTISNNNGMEVDITDFGGIVVALRVPDKEGEQADVVLGFDSLEPYLENSPYLGCIVGRHGNRIAGGRFTLEGTEYALAQNNGENHLHGGIKGFNKVMWHADEYDGDDDIGITLNYMSADGEEGYPGNLTVAVAYRLTTKNEFLIDYTATTDKTTIVNLTNHSYFNLSGEGSGDILQHELMIDAGCITPMNDAMIPTGALMDVTDTPMDFRTPTAIGARITDDFNQLTYGGGYDHNYVINNHDGTLRAAARVCDPFSGRCMAMRTTEPGVQLYVGNFLDGTLTGKSGKPYNKRDGLCLETQHYPDAPNQPDFPSTTLKPGDMYRHTTVFAFSAT